jgi:hypothetical protein
MDTNARECRYEFGGSEIRNQSSDCAAVAGIGDPGRENA